MTFLLTDVERSTRHWQADHEAALAAHLRHDAILAETVARHSGRLVTDQGEGDSAFVAFETPSQALGCAADLQRAFQQEQWPGELVFRIRMGVHTGDAAFNEGNYHGAEVNRCGRIRSLAWGGQVLVSRATADLAEEHIPSDLSLRSLGRHVIKDFEGEHELFQLCGSGLEDGFPPLRSATRAHNLPLQLTSFVGRDEELERTKGLLGAVRMLTLVGSGGCGKSRLAIEVAGSLVPDFQDGVWWVELAPLTSGDLVPNAVAAAMGLREEGTRSLSEIVMEHLREKRTLLVLDNCEHLTDAAGDFIRDLLVGSPGTTILATSREPLGLVGETTWVVPSLSVPAGGSRAESQIAESDAVKLFVERAQQVDPTFRLNPSNAAAVAQICTRLDGIPLALELAAARLRAFSPTQIAERLDDRFELLTGGPRSALPRQQTLRAMVDWSYDLLDEDERLLLHRLSVFPASFSFDAVRSVCGQEHDPSLSTLIQLVERSLVATDDSTGTRRYRLLETIRSYAADRADGSGETTGLRDRLLAWCGQVVDAWRQEGGRSSELDAIEVEHDNIRAALSWGATGGDPEIGIRIVGQLWRFWYIRGYLTEGRNWADTMLRTAPHASAALRADAMHCGGILSYRLGDYEAAERFHEASLELRRTMNDASGIAASLNNLGLIAFERRELEKAKEMFQRCLDLRRELGDMKGLASPLNNLGLVADALDDHVGARAAYEESLELQRSLGDDWGVGLVLDNLGQLEQKQGNFGAAAALHLEALDLWRLIGDDVSVADCLERLAGVAAAGGDSEDAAILFGAAEHIRETIGSPVGSRDREHYDADVSKARAGLDEATFRSAWERGRDMDVQSAAQLAAGVRTRV